MSFQDGIKFWEAHLNTHWTLTPIKWENVPFDPTHDGGGNPNPYIALLIRETTPAGGGDVTLGSDNPFFRWSGITLISIFLRENTGLGLGLQYADRLKGIFRQSVAIVGFTDISILQTDNSFNSTTTDFITHGVVVGMQIVVSGFANPANNGVFTVTTVTQRKIQVTATLVTAVAGSAIHVHGFKVFQYGSSGMIRTRMSHMNNVGITHGWEQINLHIPFVRDSQE